MESDDPKRELARQFAAESLRRGDPTGWFDQLYAKAAGDSDLIPWATLRPNANLTPWLDKRPPAPPGLRATVVGSGLGDDAEELARRGYDVSAFDVSGAAIGWARRRFPDSEVRYSVADLFDLSAALKRSADLVIEIYTVQAMPVAVREKALQRVADLVAPGGNLLLICRARNDDDDPGDLPWPISKKELGALPRAGLTELSLEDFLDNENPPVRRFRALYTR